MTWSSFPSLQNVAWIKLIVSCDAVTFSAKMHLQKVQLPGSSFGHCKRFSNRWHKQMCSRT
eukprot:6484730-Amphidinium_carterae.1